MKVLFVEAEEVLYMPIITKLPKRWAYLVETATYIKSKRHDVKIMDCMEPSISHGEILQEICNTKYDAICFLMRTETISSLLKLMPIIKNISPNSKLIGYGDSVSMFPNYIIKNFDALDAIVREGDWEEIILKYLNYIETKNPSELTGIMVRENGNLKEYPTYQNTLFNNWCFPDLNDGLGNKNLYLSLRHNELTFSVSRGCPFNCKFCLASKTFNKKDRRKDIKDIVNYMKANEDKVDSFKLFSPTFTVNTKWTKDLCNLMIQESIGKPWVATSRIDCLLDEEMVELLGNAKCKKIAVGIETLDEESRKEINKLDNVKDYKKIIKSVYNLTNKYGVEIKPLLMLGIKGQTLDSMNKTINFLKDCGAKNYRVSSYSPRQILTEKDATNELKLEEILEMDKMTYVNYMPKEMDKEAFYRMIYSKGRM